MGVRENIWPDEVGRNTKNLRCPRHPAGRYLVGIGPFDYGSPANGKGVGYRLHTSMLADQRLYGDHDTIGNNLLPQPSTELFS
jgi:hypothetical protein